LTRVNECDKKIEILTKKQISSKNRKKSLTKGERCGNIVKLSQRDGAKKAAESRPIEGKELAEGKRRSEAGTKNLEKR